MHTINSKDSYNDYYNSESHIFNHEESDRENIFDSKFQSKC